MTVDAGPDKYLCPDDVVVLEGNITGDFDDFEWTPENGLSDPRDLQPEAEQTGVYTLTATFNTGVNIIQNGDFSQGATGFTSGYEHSTQTNPVTCPSGNQVFGRLGCEGTYDVMTDPSQGHTNFAACSDQSGDGNMMVINGASTANVNVWCQTVAVNPNSSYEFSAWVTSVNPDNPARLQFLINGQLLGGIFGPGGVCDWSEHTAEWDANGATSAEICLVNQNTNASGNDFAIDNIQFVEICKVEDEVEVFPVDMSFTIEQPQDLTCTNTTVILSVQTNTQSSSFYSGTWIDPQGNEIPTLPPNYELVASEPGDYTFIYVFNNGETRCEETETVDVGSQIIDVDAEAEVDGTIGCNEGVAFLTALNGDDFQYFWSSNDGHPIEDPTSDEIQVEESGYYTLAVTDPFTGCGDTIEVFVPRSEDIPDAFIDAPEVLNCNNTSVFLDASDSNLPPNTDIIWSTNDGHFIDDTDILDPEVDSAGTYQLILLNQATGCSDTAEIVVEASYFQPQADLQDSVTLTCDMESFIVRLDDIDAQTEIVWTTPSGSIEDSTSLDIIEPGTYSVELLHSESQCASEDTIHVIDDRDFPVSSINVPEILNCDRDTVLLSAALNQPNPNVSLSWSDPNGNVLSMRNDLAVDAPDWYYFTATNSENGCMYRDSVQVGIDTISPDVATGDSIIFSCDDDVVTISGSTSNNNNIQTTWLNPDGSILVRNQWDYEVSNTGTYTLVVENTQNGCSSSATQVVSPDQGLPSLTISSVDTLTCSRNSIVLVGNGTASSGGDLSYQWVDEQGNVLNSEDDLQVNMPGSYTLILTDVSNGCTVSQQVEVPIDTITPMAALNAPDTLSCVDSVVQVFVADYNSDLIYTWSTSNGDIIQTAPDGSSTTVAESGIYVVSVTDPGNGCSTTRSINVDQNFSTPNLRLNEVQAITCRDTSIELSLNVQSDHAYSISWFNALGNNLAMDVESISTDQPGTYQVLVRDLVSGCDVNEFFTVPIDSDTLPITTEVPLDLDCENEEVRLGFNVEEGSEFNSSWFDDEGNVLAQNSEEIMVQAAGNYFIEIVNEQNGCLSRASVKVDRIAERPDTLVFQVDPAVCNVEFGRVQQISVRGGTAPYSFYLNGNRISENLGQYSAPIGDNVLKVVDDRNCEITQEFEVPHEAGVLFELPPQYEIELGDKVKLIPRFARGENDINTIEWEVPDFLSCTNCLEPLASPTENMDYSLLIEDNKGCTHRSTTKVLVFFDPNVFIPNAFSPNGDGANDYFFPQSQSKWIRSIKDFRIYSRWGEEVYRKDQLRVNVEEDGWDGNFNGQPMDPAVFVYYVEVEFINGEKELFSGDVTLIR